MSLVPPAEPVALADLGRVHFAAIGGAGMSGVARIMLARGLVVSGCDTGGSDQLAQLASLGARVSAGHSPEHLSDADTLVVSSAIRPDNPELIAARQRGIRVMHRSSALASLMLGRRSITISGTHGKTTTTSMLTTVLRYAGAAPSYVIGGVLAETGLGAEDGAGELFVAEADESDGSFLNFAPEVAVITCVEADHLDNYGDLAEIERAFAGFAARVRPGGLLITGADDPGARRIAAGVTDAGRIRLISYGANPAADYRVTGVTADQMATEFEIVAGERTRLGGGGGARPRIAVPGRHNAMNATAAYAAAVELGFGPDLVAEGLARYQGASRRMEPKGEVDGVRVLDSYAHHPTELAADLAAARDLAVGGRVIAIFQPHLFSRTRFFAAEFGAALGQADEVIVGDVYAAREDPEPGVSGALITSAVPGGRATFCPNLDAAPALVAELAKPGDLVLTMGAGDVTRLGPLIVAELRRRGGGAG